MPYNSSTSAYERRAATVIDATPDGDTVAIAIDVKLDQSIDDYVTDMNHHAVNGNHFPATSVGIDSRFLKQSPAGVVSWADGVVAANAALKDFSNVANGAIVPEKIAQDTSNRFVSDTEKGTWNGALYDMADVEGVLTGIITSHTHPAASESAAGVVELATTTEASTGTDTSRAVTAAGVDAYHKARNIVLGTPVTAATGAVDFTGIPAGVKRIVVTFGNVSTSGTSLVVVRIGSGSAEATGYDSKAEQLASILAFDSNTTGFLTNSINDAARGLFGFLTLTHHGNNAWVLNGSLGVQGGNAMTLCAGIKSLSGVLDRLRVTTLNGTDTFDAGTINISWEF